MYTSQISAYKESFYQWHYIVWKGVECMEVGDCMYLFIYFPDVLKEIV